MPPEESNHDVSALLIAWSGGDGDALDRLTPIVYHELRRLARHYMQQERAGHTLQSTALVHEAYTRLVDYKRMQWQSRAHFFAVAAQLMRRILVEHARRRQKVKRGAGFRRLTLDESVLADVHDPELVALDDALTELEKLDRRKVQVVEMRYFGGLSVEETAEVLKVSTVTVKRDWRSAKVWLYRALTAREYHGSPTVDTG